MRRKLSPVLLVLFLIIALPSFAQSDPRIADAKETMKNFFYLCAKEDIYFDSTQPSYEFPGWNNVELVVEYESEVNGVAYDPFFRLFVDGGTEYGISSACHHGITDKEIYYLFTSAILDLKPEDAASLVDEWFMQSYLDGDMLIVDEPAYQCIATFTSDYRILYIAVE